MQDVRLPDFHFTMPLDVWFRELDAMGHVNNAVYFTYFEEARSRYWMSLLSEGHEPWDVTEIWLSAHPISSDFIDVTKHIDTKFQALRCHLSQLPDPDGMETRFRQMMGANAVKAGFDEGTFVEGYRVVQAS